LQQNHFKGEIAEITVETLHVGNNRRQFNYASLRREVASRRAPPR